jgi:hypothetical protein
MRATCPAHLILLDLIRKNERIKNLKIPSINAVTQKTQLNCFSFKGMK